MSSDKKNHCEECCAECSYYDLCEACCDHSDICTDERCCLICGEDMTEEIMSAAYDRAKDIRKYGED